MLFALSGYFVMAALYKSRGRYERPITAFAYQRFFRLFPLYWLSLILGVMFPWDDPAKAFSLAVIAINATMLQGFVFVENVIGLYWTLQIEITFYVLCILLFALRLGARYGEICSSCWRNTFSRCCSPPCATSSS